MKSVIFVSSGGSRGFWWFSNGFWLLFVPCLAGVNGDSRAFRGILLISPVFRGF